jgi:hypothetical protein
MGLLAAMEAAVKKPVFGCRMCGQCVLRCVWLRGYQRSRRRPLLPAAWRDEFNHLRPPVDTTLRGTSSWRNFANGRDRRTPAGWEAGEH